MFVFRKKKCLFCYYVVRNSFTHNIKTKDYPTWVLAHKVKGTEIRHFNDRFYLYKISSFWDKEQKKSRKKIDCLLGQITEEGLKVSKPQISEEKASQISVVESGLSEYIHSQNEDILVTIFIGYVSFSLSKST